MMIRQTIAGLLTVMTSCGIALGYDAIDDQVQQELDRGAFLGAVVMVGRPGEILYAKAYGQRDVGQPMQIDSIFDVASVTKAATVGTGLAVTMTEHPQMKLDDVMRNWLPAMTGKGSDEITIRHSATHLSGVDNVQHIPAELEGQELIDAIVKGDVLWPVGSRYKYSCHGIIRLSVMMSRLSELSFAEYCQSRIFDPLEMKDTFFSPLPEHLLSRCVRFERSQRGVCGDIRVTKTGVATGNAGLFTTAFDLSKIATLWLQMGEYNGQRLFSEEVAKQIMEGGIVWRRGGSRSGGFSENAISHGGSTGQLLIIDPDINAYVIVLTNFEHPAVRAETDARGARGRIAQVCVEQFFNRDILMHEAPRVYPGQKAKLKGRVRMPAGGEGSLVVKGLGDDSEIRMALVGQMDQEHQVFELASVVPADVKPGRYKLQVEVRDTNGEVTAESVAMIEVGRPIDGRLYCTLTEDGREAVTVRLSNASEQVLTGTLKVILAGEAGQEAKEVGETAVEIPPKQSVLATMPLPDGMIRAGRHYEMKAEFNTAGGALYVMKNQVSLVRAARLENVNVDGVLDDWSDVDAVVLRAPDDVVRSASFMPEGVVAQVRYAWDEEHLYLAVEVTGTVFVQEYQGYLAWRNDCLQLAFDLGKGEVDETGLHPEVRRISEINVALTPGGPEVFRTNSWNSGLMPIRMLKGVDAVVVWDGKKLVYEVAFPWAKLGADVKHGMKVGDRIGVVVAVNDVQSADQPDPSALGMFGGIAPVKDTEAYGTLVLMGPKGD